MNERSLAVGVSYIGYGEPGDGVPATDFTQLPIIHEGSVVFNFSDPTSVDFRAEGMKDPWASFDKAGDPDSIEFAIPSPTAVEMKEFCGGTATGDKWEAPTEIPSIKKTIKMQTSPYEGKYTEYCIVNGKVSARLSQAPGAEQTDLLLIKVTKLAAVTTAGLQKAPFTREVKVVTLPSE